MSVAKLTARQRAVLEAMRDGKRLMLDRPLPEVPHD